MSAWRWSDGWPLLLLVPVSLALLGLLRARRAARARRHLGPRAEQLVQGRERGAGARERLLALALLAGVVAWLGPRGQTVVPLVPGAGVDLVVALDLSRSMLARDVTPSRWEGARHALTSLAEDVRGDRLALVTFAGEAELQVPLTHDAPSWALRLDAADPLTTTRGGSDLERALAAALQALPAEAARPAAVLLVTDGEHQGAALEARTAELVERGVRVHALVLGSSRGRRIPVPDGEGEAFLQDRAGLSVLTRADEGPLRAVCAATGGVLLRHAEGALDGVLPAWYEARVSAQANELLPDPSRAARRELFQWPLAAALLLGLLAAAWPVRERSS